MVGFGFLGAYVADKAPICDVFTMVMGNVCFVDESDGVSSTDAAPNSLGKVAKFIGRGDGPLALVDGVL